jgi:hypothetical protein
MQYKQKTVNKFPDESPQNFECLSVHILPFCRIKVRTWPGNTTALTSHYFDKICSTPCSSLCMAPTGQDSSHGAGTYTID